MLLKALCFASLIAAAGAARADGYDAPRPPALAVTNWSGFYGTAGYGYGFWQAETTTQNPVTGACVLCATQDQGGKGWVGKVGIGYDAQVSRNIVIGAFADYQRSSLKGDIQDQTPFFVGEVEGKDTYSVGARAGWLILPQVLSYYSAGYTHMRFDGANMSFTFANAPPTGFSTSDYSGGGWFIGSGLEISVGSGWFWRNEVRYAEYSKKVLTDSNAAGVRINDITFEPTVQTATTEIVYKFNWGH